MAQRRKRSLVAPVVLLLLVGSALAMPAIYRAHVNHAFAVRMDREFGRHGWGIIRLGADHQCGEQLHLYRTLYVRFLHPRFKQVTPWRSWRFTHETSCVHRPWHYWVTVITPGREITYYWSIRENRWENMWDNAIEDYPRQFRRMGNSLPMRIGLT